MVIWQDFSEARVVLENHFAISGEGVSGSFQHLRLDLVLSPKQDSMWKRPDLKIGVVNLQPQVHHEQCPILRRNAAVKRAVEYAMASWDEFEGMPIFFYPQIFPVRDFNSADFLSIHRFSTDPWVNQLGLLGQFLIGELRFTEHRGLSMVFAHRDYLWCEREGVLSGKKRNLIRKYGHQ